jgi:hypothetical protein
MQYTVIEIAWRVKKEVSGTGCGGTYGHETSRLTRFLKNRLTDGGEVVILTRRTPFTSGLGQLGNGTRDLPACSTVRQPVTPPPDS